MAESRAQAVVAETASIVETPSVALVAGSTDETVNIGLHEELLHSFGEGAQEIASIGLSSYIDKWYRVFDPPGALWGYRGILGAGVAATPP